MKDDEKKARDLPEHMRIAKEGIKRRKALYEKHKRPFDLNSHNWFYRNQVTIQLALLDASLAILAPIPDGVSPAVSSWRDKTLTSKLITRVYFKIMVQKHGPCTVSEIEVACPDMTGFEYDRKTIKACLDDGVELALLTRSVTGVTTSYAPTLLLKEEMFQRALIKVTDPRITRFAKVVATFAQMIELGKFTMSMEAEGEQTFETSVAGHPIHADRMLQERLMDGEFDELLEAFEDIESDDGNNS
ncbi:MAG: hypothetical protein P8R39_11475 [Alphaproteobacteria bacterium]|nr:hypothetical protein [Alphaproteobacteria bacterium]